MRDYASVAPQFWTGKTGKKLREAGADAQRVALYLITCPSANALGLYYLPLPTLCHEVGISEEGASEALRRLFLAHFSHYDTSSEYVWVPEMARFQIGESLSAGDKRVKWIIKELMSLSKSPFFNEFLEKYRDLFKLQSVEKISRPIEGPSMPHRSQEQEQEQEQEIKRIGANGAPTRKSEDSQKQKFDPSSILIPDSLNNPRFVAKWKLWIAYRMKFKKPKGPAEMFRLQLEKLVPFGVDASIEAIDKSMMNGYQGIFPEVKKNGHHVVVEPGAHPLRSEKERTENEQDLIRSGIEFLSSALDNPKLSESEKFKTVVDWSGLLEAKRSVINKHALEKVDALLERAAAYKKSIAPKVGRNAHAH